ncbi:MAG: hypothetical protein ACO3GP_01180 [Candidatus Limnocylindrus sp.]
MHTTSRITLSPRRKPLCGRTQKSTPRTDYPLRLYNALALLTDYAKRLTQDIENPIATKINLEFLVIAIKSAETILIKYPTKR